MDLIGELPTDPKLRAAVVTELSSRAAARELAEAKRCIRAAQELHDRAIGHYAAADRWLDLQLLAMGTEVTRMQRERQNAREQDRRESLDEP